MGLQSPDSPVQIRVAPPSPRQGELLRRQPFRLPSFLLRLPRLFRANTTVLREGFGTSSLPPHFYSAFYLNAVRLYTRRILQQAENFLGLFAFYGRLPPPYSAIRRNRINPASPAANKYSSFAQMLQFRARILAQTVCRLRRRYRQKSMRAP